MAHHLIEKCEARGRNDLTTTIQIAVVNATEKTHTVENAQPEQESKNMGRKFRIVEWDGNEIETDYVIYRASPMCGPYLDMVRSEGGKTVKSKLYILPRLIVEDLDHNESMAEVIEKSENLLRDGEQIEEHIRDVMMANQDAVSPNDVDDLLDSPSYG